MASSSAEQFGSQTPLPIVSIVINNYNYARFLARSIDSALAQTYPNVDVVVIDDASTDGSADVIRSYGTAIVSVLKNTNGGQGSALNAGFSISRGDIIIFLDADDYLYPDAASQVAQSWKAGISKAHYRLDLVDADEKFLDLYPAPEISFDSGDVVPLLLTSGRYETSVTSGNAFARSALAAIMPMPEGAFRISADGYLVTLAPFYGEVLSIEKSLGAYRQHGLNYWSGVNTASAAASFSRSLEHDREKYRVLANKAVELGFRVAPEPGMADHTHLSSRIACLRLDPAQHPYPADTRLGLTLRGMWASRKARLPWARRALLATWFMCVGVLPLPLARRAVAWRMVKSSRPNVIKMVLPTVRRMTPS